MTAINACALELGVVDAQAIGCLLELAAHLDQLLPDGAGAVGLLQAGGADIVEHGLPLGLAAQHRQDGHGVRGIGAVDLDAM